MTAAVAMGYLIDHHADFTVVQSPFTFNGQRTYGADSDGTTLAVAALLHRLSHEPVPRVTVPEGMDGDVVHWATGVETYDGDDDAMAWELYLGDEAIVVLARHGADVELHALEVEVEVDPDFQNAITDAWVRELKETHVSQGAYVSRPQYEEAAASRLGLEGQKTTSAVIWPPRYSSSASSMSTRTRLAAKGSVQSWTTLSAAGAPSEFSIRAPILGGITTVFMHLDEGPSGVFLTVDDEENHLEFGQSMELVVRRVYAQEGFIRYGLKARAIE